MKLTRLPLIRLQEQEPPPKTTMPPPPMANQESPANVQQLRNRVQQFDQDPKNKQTVDNIAQTLGRAQEALQQASLFLSQRKTIPAGDYIASVEQALRKALETLKQVPMVESLKISKRLIEEKSREMVVCAQAANPKLALEALSVVEYHINNILKKL